MPRTRMLALLPAPLRRCGLAPIVAALIVAALALLPGRTAWAQSAGTVAGTVIGISGECFVVGSGGSRAALRLGQPVQVGDILDVSVAAKLKLRMADGSIVAIASATRMEIRAYTVDAAGQRQDVNLSLGQGLLRAVVAPVTGPAKFEVDTAVGTAAVRSTDWFVEASPAAMQVGVLDGTIVMTSEATGRSITIPTHWGGRLEAGRDPVPPRVWRQAEFDAVIARTEVP